MKLLPRRWVFATTQIVMTDSVGLLVPLPDRRGWVSIAFYLWGVLMGSLLISQFWTLANDVYDARQAKRVFGFIGGGSSLGGMVGAGFAANYAKKIGTNNLLVVAAVILGLCFARDLDDHAAREARRQRQGRRRGGQHQPSGGDSAPDAVQALPGHRARHQLRGDRRRDRRAADEHGRRGLCHRQGRADRDHRERHLLLLARGLHHPDDAHVAAAPPARHRLRAAAAADHAGQHRRPDADGSDAVDLRHGARRGHRASLQRRQDHARDPLHAAPDGHEVSSQAVRGRGRRSVRQGAGRADAHRGDQGPRLHLVAAQLHQSRRRGVVGPSGAARPKRVPAKLPQGARGAADRHEGSAHHRGGPRDDRDARRGAGAPGRGARRAMRSKCWNRWTSATS